LFLHFLGNRRQLRGLFISLCLLPKLILIVLFNTLSISPKEAAPYYDSTVEDFLNSDFNRDSFSEFLVEKHLEFSEGNPPEVEQVNAWKSEFDFLKRSFDDEHLHKAYLALEMPLWRTRDRADALLFGRNENGEGRISLMEFKTWHTQRRKQRRYEIYPYINGDVKKLFINLFTYKSNVDFQINSDLHEDPRKQVLRYYDNLFQAMKNSRLDISPDVIQPSVVLYNCAKLSEEFRFALDRVLEQSIFEKVPLYAEQSENGAKSLDELIEALRLNTAKNDGEALFKKTLKAIQS